MSQIDKNTKICTLSFLLDFPILLIIGGYAGDYLSSVETVDLREDFSCSTQQTDLPYYNAYNIGMSDQDGNPMSCGGNQLDYDSGCLVYIKELDQWEEGPSMNFLRDMGSTSVRLSDGRYFVIGTNIDAEYYIRSFC